MEGVKETILCAAIWYRDLESQQFRPRNCEGGIIVCGWRHSNCIATFNQLSGLKSNTVESGDYVQGFLTNFNRFVDRKEAVGIAEEAGQIINDQYNPNQLFSEDIY